MAAALYPWPSTRCVLRLVDRWCRVFFLGPAVLIWLYRQRLVDKGKVPDGGVLYIDLFRRMQSISATESLAKMIPVRNVE